MTEKMIDNRVLKLRKLEAEQQRLQEEAEKIKDELKAELEALEVDELATGNFTIRWKSVISNRLDSKLLKLELPDIYEKFSKSNTTRRFTITA